MSPAAVSKLLNDYRLVASHMRARSAYMSLPSDGP